MTARTLIQNAIVLTMVAGSKPRVQDVYIDGDRIVAIGDQGRPFPPDQANTTIDAPGCVVMPGLINIHTHSPMTLMRGTFDGIGFPHRDTPPTMPPDQDWRGLLQPEDHAISTRLAMIEMIHSGTTTFVDMYHDMDQVAKAVIEVGLRAALGSEIHTFRVDPEEWLPYDEEIARKSFEQSADFAAAWNGKGEGRVTTLVAPHESGSTCVEPWLSRSAELAGELGLGISIHVAESQWEVAYCRETHGLTPVELLHKTGILEHRVIGAHSLYLTDSDISLLSDSNYSAAPCLRSYLKMATRVTPVPKLLNAGVNVGLGTDSALTNNNLSLWNEIYLNATLHGFLGEDPSLIGEDVALEMATVGGAKALGFENELGTLEVNKKADLIVLDSTHPNFHPLEGVLVSNLVYASGAFQVRDMLVDGKIIMRDGVIETVDECETIRAADDVVRGLRDRVNLPLEYVKPKVSTT